MKDELEVELSIVMPCLNEAETLGICIAKAKSFLSGNGIAGEIMVADNGSSDGSLDIVHETGVRHIDVRQKGYGSALRAGINAAKGKYIVMGDADDSYDFSSLDEFVRELRNGNDLVMGNRFKGGIKDGAMPFLHRYLGNPLLSFVGRSFFGSTIGDFHCGLRGFRKEAIESLHLRTNGMEFASEMVVKASLKNLRISEVPTVLHPDGRSRKPYLRTWRDGWRHLRFMLLYSPNWLFFYPGIILSLLGVIVTMVLFFGPLDLGGVVLDIHTMIYSGLMVLVGTQMVVLSLMSKTYLSQKGLLEKDSLVDKFNKYFNLELFLLAGIILMITGVALSLYIVKVWSAGKFGPLAAQETLRVVIPAVMLFLLGFNTVLNSFYFGIIKFGEQNEAS